jgi:phage repressor protein C with HTH and peptisase S24 domain
MQEHSCNAPPESIFANAFHMDGIEEDSRFIKALVDWLETTPAAVARKINVANTTINRHHKGMATTRLSKSTLDKLHEAYPRFPGFNNSNTVEEADERAYVSVNVLPSYAGMGGGGNGDGGREVAKMPRRLIEEDLRGRAEDFDLIDVRGDSMEPDFHHGDQILIDRRDRDPRQAGPFALWDDDGYVIKLVERVPQKRGFYRVFSANHRYSSYEIEESSTTIMGRPVWFARRL